MEGSGSKNDREYTGSRRGVLAFLLVVIILFIAWYTLFIGKGDSSDQVQEDVTKTENRDKIENGIHLRTGLKDDEGLMTVITHCTACHSAQLVIQNRMNEERWNATIRWMQETQNLWDLGKNQEVIVNYLVKNYPPTEKGRRENLKEPEWYELKE